MKFTVLCKYGPFATSGGKSTSSYLVESENQACVLDLGSGSVSKLLEKISLNKLKFVFLSHMHFDHVSDFGVLSYAINFLNKGEKINLYAYNDGSDLYNLIKSNSAFNIIDVEVGKEYRDGDFTFSFYKMAHPVISHGIKLMASRKTLAYTGDTTIQGDIDNLVQNADLLIADGCFLQNDYSENKPHMSIKQVCEIANKYNIKTVVSHISYNYSDDEVISEIEKFSKLSSIAMEGKTYKV